MVADLPDIHVEEARAGVLLEEAPDRLRFEVASDEDRRLAEVDAQDDGVVVRILEAGLFL